MAAAGDRINARCTRCKDITGHIVVAVMNGEIAKVECCACKSVHKYHEPAKKKEVVEAKTVRVRAGEERSIAVQESKQCAKRMNEVKEPTVKAVKKVSSTKSEKANIKQLEDMQAIWKDRMVSYSNNAKTYSMDITLTRDEFVEHPVFGVGFVIELYPPNKADILFSEGLKSLRCVCS